MLLEDMSAVDALYMTVITLTTVGFGEVQPLSTEGRVFTIFLITLGVGTVALALRNAAELALGHNLWLSVQRRRMNQQIDALEDHYIVCGYGRLGHQIGRDLRRRGEPFVVVDLDERLEEELIEQGVPFLNRDATLDETLVDAGIERARGLVASVDTDANNVLIVLTAREMNPRLLVVARSNSEASESKLRRAGADRVVTPEMIGGHRLAVALLRPAVHDFLNRIFSVAEEQEVDVGQITIPEGSPIAGQTIARCDLRNIRNVSILAIRGTEDAFTFNPDPSRTIAAGETLILIGPANSIYELEALYSREA